MKLDLGSGHRDRDGFVTLDRNPDVNPDIVHDLRRTPLPLDSDTADIIRADHVLEHLPVENFIDVMYEIHRILKPDGQAIITGPHYLNHNTPAGNHFRGFSETSFDFLTPSHDYEDSADLFNVETTRWRFRNSRASIHVLRQFMGDMFVAKHVPNTVEELEFTLSPIQAD